MYKYQTFADLLYASYSGLQMMAFAFAKGKDRYGHSCYAFRETVTKKYKSGEMQIGNLYQNWIRQLTCPHDSCWYCGRPVSECAALSADHVFPRAKGGESISDNLIMVCKSCNSSKGAKDLLGWYYERGEFPPMRVLAHYLKLVNQYAIAHDLLDVPLVDMDQMDLPFDFHFLPLSYPAPAIASSDKPMCDFKLKRLEEVRSKSADDIISRRMR